MAAKKVAKKVLKTKSKPALRAPVTKGAVAAAPGAGSQPAKRVPPANSPAGSLAGLNDLSSKEQQVAVKALRDKINKAFKGPVVVPADEAHSNSYLRRPTGVMQLDLDLGGGFPAASFCTIGGPNNAGKSTLLYSTFAQHQRLYGERSCISLLSPEGNIDYAQARRVGWIVPYPPEVIAGIRASRKVAGAPDLTAEEIAEMRRGIGINEVVYGLSTAEEYLDILLSQLESNLFGVIGLDSYEALMPSAEATLDSLEDFPQQAARASIIGRFLQHYGPIKRNPQHFSSFLMTCQIRFNRKKQEAASFMQKYIKDWAEVVPDVVRHWRTNSIVVWGGAKEKDGDKDAKGPKLVVGKDVNWELTKGKEGTHDNIMGSTTYWYDERCFDIQRSVMLAGLRYGVIQEVGGLLTLYKNGEPHEYLRNIPADLFVQALEEEPEAEWDARRTILHARGLDCLYR